MVLPIPPHIERAAVSSAPVAHAWDDSDPEFAYVGLDERLQHRIGKISDRGVLALSAGFAEWVAFRHVEVCRDPIPFQKIEAVWAAVVDWRYMKPVPLPSRDAWQGPALGAVWSAANWLDRIVDLIKREQFPSPESVCLSQLALYVLPDPEPFKKWRRFAVERLVKFHPLDPADALGAPVPRDALDPDVSYDPAAAKSLIDAFLRELDPARNPFLASAAEMKSTGFPGTPYRFE